MPRKDKHKQDSRHHRGHEPSESSTTREPTLEEIRNRPLPLDVRPLDLVTGTKEFILKSLAISAAVTPNKDPRTKRYRLHWRVAYEVEAKATQYIHVCITTNRANVEKYGTNALPAQVK